MNRPNLATLIQCAFLISSCTAPSSAPIQTPIQAPIPSPFPTETPTQRPTPLPTPVGPIEIPANPEKGFGWPYLLYVPSNTSGGHMLVVPNNTGRRSNDFSVHEESAKDTMSGRRTWANELKVPLLVPIFPRFSDDSDGTIASQYLGRGTLEKSWQTRYPALAREDLQLIAMVDDAIGRIRAIGVEVDTRIFIEGYSASAMFASRFMILHPDRIQAAAFGGHGWTIVPTDKWGKLPLPYPYGTGDIDSLTGESFDLNEFKRVAIYSYMGELDDNGWALPWYMGGGYDRSRYYSSFKTIFGSSAQRMSDSANQIYQSVGCSATFVVYTKEDHQSAYSHSYDITHFFEEHR